MPSSPVFRALAHRNYRLFFSGQGLSLIGTWISRVATSWLVYRLTNSAFLLGLVSFAGLIPTFLLSPLAGVLADRWNLRRVLLITQVLSMVQSFLLAGLALAHVITITQLIVLSVLQGIVNAFDTPARLAFVVQLVESPDDLPNAIAMNSMMFNGARLVGPMVAGLLIAGLGEGLCFLVDGVSYLAVIASLVAMRVPAHGRSASGREIWGGLKEGFAYVMGFAPIRAILLLVSATSLLGVPFMVLLPVFASQILHGGAHTYGFLASATGLGALGGALFLAARRSVRGLGRVIVIGGLVFGGGLVAFALSRVLWLALLLLFVTGFGMMTQTAACNTIIQTIVDDDKRGRVMSLYTVAVLGMAPFGSLGAGAVAARIGTPLTILVGGVACLLGILLFARNLPAMRELIRPIYLEKGIIPGVARGIEGAS